MTAKFFDSIIILRFGRDKSSKRRILVCKKSNKNLGC